MSEKRFIVIDNDFSKWVEDTTYKEDKHEGTLYDVYDMCRKLNELVDKLNSLADENEQLKKAEKINMEYAEQIVEENKKLRIAKNDLRIENEQLNNELEEYKELQNEIINFIIQNRLGTKLANFLRGYVDERETI